MFNLSVTFTILAAFTVLSAFAVLGLRNLVHCALALSLTMLGLAAIYLELSAQFVGFAQVLVYVGAVAILIVFAILLTRGGEVDTGPVFASGWGWGLGLSIGIFILLSALLLSSSSVKRPLPPVPEVTVQQIGERLMGPYLLPLELVGVLLTVALIGAVVLALNEEEAR